MSWRFWKHREVMPHPGEPGWEQALANHAFLDHLKEHRRSRRWGIFFKILTFAYLTVFLVFFQFKLSGFDPSISSKEGHTALIEVTGFIAPKGGASADRIATALRKAYEDENTKGVILRINSPGGSPVQSGYISDEIHRLRKKYPDIPVYAVASDLCASGGYYIAVAADAIYDLCERGKSGWVHWSSHRCLWIRGCPSGIGYRAALADGWA